MKLTQSFVFSVAAGDASLYELRIIFKIVEFAQPVLKGLYLAQNLTQLSHNYDNVHIKLPVSSLVADSTHNYDVVRAACRNLMTKVYEVWDESNQSYFATPLIYNFYSQRGEGILHFYVARRVFDAILDFRRGYCQFELNIANSIKSANAARMYILMCSQPAPISFSIDYLKKMFGVQDKYKQTRDFIKRVIEPSRKELEAMHVSSFAYEAIKTGCKVTSIRFTPIHRREHTTEELAAMVSVTALVDTEVRIFLINAFGFSVKELGAHKVLLEQFCKLPYKFDVLYSLRDRVRRKGKSKGYVIEALRSEVKGFAERFKQIQNSKK